MPELPEVETVVRTIRPLVWGCEIASFIYTGAGKPPNVTINQVQGQTIKHVSRLGKFIIFKLDAGYLVSHLRMTGQWHFADATRPAPNLDKHFRWGMAINGHNGAFAGYFWFKDVRKFGTLDWTKTLPGYGPFQRLGVDGLHLGSTKTVLKIIALAAKSRRPIKNFLLDQSVIAGTGNIYASEVLFESRVDRTDFACDLPPTAIEKICHKLYDIFLRSIDLGGSSISDYVGGRYQEVLSVYGREGECCVTCGDKIKKMTQAGRGTYYCPACQGVDT